MAFSDYEELNLIGMHIKNVTWGGERLSVSFGSGYSASAVVGVAHGLHRWRIQGRYMPDNSVLMIGTQTWFDYYYEFYKARTMGDVETFIIQWREKYWHVKFADPDISFDAFKRTGGHYEHSQGLELVQVRVSGLVYESDGSVDLLPPCPPDEVTAEGISASTIRVRWSEADDDCAQDVMAPCPPFGLTAEATGSTTIQLVWEEALDTGDCTAGGGPIDTPDDYLLML